MYWPDLVLDLSVLTIGHVWTTTNSIPTGVPWYELDIGNEIWELHHAFKPHHVDEMRKRWRR